MKTKFLLALNVGVLFFLTTQNSWANINCQGDASGNIQCVNNCAEPMQNNVQVNLTTNQINRKNIQKIIYNYNSIDGQGTDIFSTLSDQGDLSYRLSRNFPLNLNLQACQANPNYNNSLVISKCRILSFSGSPQTVDCADYLSYQFKVKN